MDERSDGTLLAAWRAGDGEAFEVLVRSHQSALLRHARSLLGAGRSGEDVVQDAFLRLAQAPPDLPPDVRGDPALERSALAAWLHRVTRNLCMDQMRSETRRRRREEEVAAHEAVDGRPGGGGATREAVEQGLLKLPPDQREVLVLRLLGDRSYREIAEITGKKVGTIGWLISVGLRALGAELAPLLGEVSPGGTQVQSLHGGPS